jgi:DNA-3-methyladenine glycosylase II
LRTQPYRIRQCLEDGRHRRRLLDREWIPHERTGVAVQDSEQRAQRLGPAGGFETTNPAHPDIVAAMMELHGDRDNPRVALHTARTAVEKPGSPDRTRRKVSRDVVNAYANGQPLDDTDHHLAASDPTMRDLIHRLGPVDLRIRGTRGNRLGALILAIVSQQLSTRVAQAIYERLLAQFDGQVPTANQLLAADQDQLRTAAGLSHAKSRALRSLAEHVADGRLTLNRLSRLPDDDVRAQLTAVTGIGAWTTDVFLMFNLRRPDILAAGDLGIRKAIQTQYGLDGLPDIPAVTRLAEPWRPYRTRACFYLWRSLETTPVPG